MVRSSRAGHGPYRIVLDDITGSVIHTPACEAWTHGRRLCRHVLRALALAEEPEATFVEDVVALWRQEAWRDKEAFATACVQGAERAKAQRQAITEWEMSRVRPAVSAEDAIREFGGVG